MADSHKDAERGLSRRSLFARSGALALGAAAAGGVVAGCENTTTPEAATGGDGSGGPGVLGDPTAGGPVDAAGIPLARRDYPVTLPRFEDPVSSSAKPERGGAFKIYTYADYLNPEVLKEFGRKEGVKVQVTTFESVDEAYSKLSSAGLEFDVIFTTPDQLSKLVGSQLLAPINHEMIPNLERNVWDEIQDPFYDIGSRYTVPYVVYTTGIGWRNDLIDLDPAGQENGWDALWNASAARGKAQLLDDKREALGMALLHAGEPNINTESQEALDGALKGLRELNAKIRPKVQISGYETLPVGRIIAGQVWSGDMLSAVISYLPKGTPATALSYWFQESGGPVFNDVITVAAAAKKPVIAHRFLNYMLSVPAAYLNFTGYVGYQPPIKQINSQKLFDDEILPKGLSNVVVTPEAYADGNGYLTLTAAGEARWEKAWGAFRAG